ncbi:MAG: hypothetical protein AAFR66_01840 [Bacteroidota bacterium]
MNRSSFLLPFILLLTALFIFPSLEAQIRKKDIPAIHSNIKVDALGVYVEVDGEKVYESLRPAQYTLEQFRGDPKGSGKGISLNFNMPKLAGTVYFGFIPYGDSKHPYPVYFKRSADILGGQAFINIKDQMSGVYDMIGWAKNEKGTIGYRVLDINGKILYDGKVSFTGNGPFKVVPTIVEGPFVNLLSSEGATISFDLHKKSEASIMIDGKTFESDNVAHHEIKIDGLTPGTKYEYTVKVGDIEQTYALTTAPDAGSRKPFTFSYASDSRNGNGGGERNVYGANFYIMKRIMALNSLKEISFMQFSGDLINGYLNSPEETDLQYANWKRSIESFAHYFPVYVSMGNHEALMRTFSNGKRIFTIDRFPYETESAEAVFNRNFVNPTNGPDSEDGASYDPDPKKMDFPPYKENVFYYTYDNVAVVVMNSDYFYAPSTPSIPVTGGGLHAYIMDQQLAWFGQTIEMLEADANIDHIFITQHTPFFPNGGHVRDDMWYSGNNDYRPYVAGKPLSKGIIERRDELLDIAVNKSEKVIAILTGDEHNYARTEVGPDTEIYPEGYLASKIQLSRTIYQINNGAAGAPYYAQEQTPWTPKVSGFTTQNALVFFHVDGKSIEMEVRNPDTLEEVDKITLR